MSEAAFTSGPWLYYQHLLWRETSGPFPNDLVKLPDISGWIQGAYNDDPEAIANARLIAAAPCLYSGCSAMLGLVQLILNRDDLSPELRAVLQADNHRIAEAEAALAKADGSP